MAEPSKEAWALAHRVDKPVYMLAHDLTWLAVALQAVLDERDEARRVAAALGDYYLSGSTGMDGFVSCDAALAAVAWHPDYARKAEHG